MVDWQAAAPRVLVIVVLVVTNVALVGAMGTSATPYGPYNGGWDGTSDLRTTAERVTDVRLGIGTAAYESLGGGSVAFVVAPQAPYDTDDSARVRQYVRRGGTLVVAAESDRSNDLLEAVGASARVDGAVLRDEQSNYRGPALPVATNVSDHPLVENVDSLTLNYGAAVVPNGATVLARTATTAYLDRNRNGTFDGDETVAAWPVATVESVGQGRVVVLGDASVLTNALLDRAGNEAFADNLLADANVVLFDQSHAGPLAPLPYALVVLRTTPVVQLAVGLGAFAVLGFVALGGPGRLLGFVRRLTARTPDPATVELTEAEIEQYLTAQHPDWDADRVRRVTKAVRRRRGNTEDDE